MSLTLTGSISGPRPGFSVWRDRASTSRGGQPESTSAQRRGCFRCYLGEGTSPEQAARARDAAVAFLAQHDLCSFRLNLPPAVPLTWKSDLGNPTELPIIRLRQELRRAVVEAGLLPLAQEDTPDGEQQDARPKRLTQYIGVRNKPVTYLQDGSSVTYHQGVVRDGWVLLCPCVHTNISLLCVPSPSPCQIHVEKASISIGCELALKVFVVGCVP